MIRPINQINKFSTGDKQCINFHQQFNDVYSTQVIILKTIQQIGFCALKFIILMLTYRIAYASKPDPLNLVPLYSSSL